MSYTPPPPTNGPNNYPWTDPPEEMLSAMRETGISDTQSIALIRSIIWQTYQELQAENKITWPYIGRWEVRAYARTEFKNNIKNVVPEPPLPPIPSTITLPTMLRISFRPDWRIKQ